MVKNILLSLIDGIQEHASFLLTISVTFLIAYYTGCSSRIAQKQMEKTCPTIIGVMKYIDHSKIVLGENNTIKVLLANNDSHGITIENVTIKRYVFKKLLSQRIKSKWKPETTNKPTNIGIVQQYLKYMVATNDVCEIYLTIKDKIKPSFYKIYVKTSGGSCQYITKLPLI